uniref:Transcription factor HES-5 n=1 Tax=Cyprinus carpio TaxID=7962 RepID=A0A8C1TND2_CYPCA
MAPTITGSVISREQLPLTNKLRKPIVEKIRRERINSSIEKLKSLLGQEFLKQQPDSRQEKADILEMTLDFLRLQQRSQNPSACSSTAARDGRSRCVQEVLQQSSVGLRLHWTLRQEVDGLLHTSGASVTSCSRAAGRGILGALLESQEIQCHLQDISFLLSGVGLLL